MGRAPQEAAVPGGERPWESARRLACPAACVPGPAVAEALANAPRRVSCSPRSQVNPPFSLSQKLDLVNVGVVRVFALPHARRSVDEMDSASLYAQVGPSSLAAGDPVGGAAPQATPPLPPLPLRPHLSPREWAVSLARVLSPRLPSLRAHDSLHLES